MKIGNVSQTVIRRSVLKQLKTKREEAVIQPSVEETCSGIAVPDGQQAIFTNVTLYGDEKDIAVFGLAQALNDLYTRGRASPVGANLSILLFLLYAYESRLKSMVEFAEQTAQRQHIQILNVKAQVSPVITKAVVTVVGIGLVAVGELIQSNMGKANQDIVLTKWIDWKECFASFAEKVKNYRRDLFRFCMTQVNALEENLVADRELKLAKEFGVSAMCQITDGEEFCGVVEHGGSVRCGRGSGFKENRSQTGNNRDM